MSTSEFRFFPSPPFHAIERSFWDFRIAQMIEVVKKAECGGDSDSAP